MRVWGPGMRRFWLAGCSGSMAGSPRGHEDVRAQGYWRFHRGSEFMEGLQAVRKRSL